MSRPAQGSSAGVVITAWKLALVTLPWGTELEGPPRTRLRPRSWFSCSFPGQIRSAHHFSAFDPCKRANPHGCRITWRFSIRANLLLARFENRYFP